MISKPSTDLKNHEDRSMAALALAKELIERGSGEMEVLHIKQFTDDEEAHDADFTQLYAEFSTEFDKAVNEVSMEYGKPIRTGEQDDEDIPLNGLFRFAIWTLDELQLYVAAAHEDRELPILLMLGTMDLVDA